MRFMEGAFQVHVILFKNKYIIIDDFSKIIRIHFEFCSVIQTLKVTVLTLRIACQIMRRCLTASLRCQAGIEGQSRIPSNMEAIIAEMTG